MSDLLAETAPVEVDAATISDGSAPSAETAVEEVSGVGEEQPKVVPAERFNGLMSKFNQTNQELAQEREHREALEARLLALEERRFDPPPSPQEDITNVSELEDLKSQVDTLTALLLEERQEKYREQVLAEHPEVAPFADLISDGGGPDAFKANVEAIAERLSGITAPTEGADPEPTNVVDSTTPPPPVTGAGSPVAPSESPVTVESRIEAAIEAKDWAAFMQAAHDRAVSDEPVLST